MSEAKHTPGPWIMEVQCNGLYIDIQPIRAYFDHGRDPVTAEDRANGRLIAAAPELLIACEAMVLAAKHNDPAAGGVAATLASVAIAKAKSDLL